MRRQHGPRPAAEGRRRCESRREARFTNTIDAAVGVSILLLGCFLALYLVGLGLIPVGAWLLHKAKPLVAGPRTDAL
jgi:hypothetical protein